MWFKMHPWAMPIILWGIGLFYLIVQVPILFKKPKTEGRNHSGVPFVGGIHFLIAGLISPCKWLAVLCLLDYAVIGSVIRSIQCQRMNKKNSMLLPIRCIVFLLVFIIGSQIVNKDLDEISNWWSIVATIVNILVIGLLVGVAKKNNQTYWELINYHKGQTKVKQLIGITILAVVVGMVGMYLAGFLCYGVIPYAAPMMIAPIPKMLAILNVFLLPITTALAEDGLYLGLGVNGFKNKYCAIIIPAFFYALQHSFIPVLLDANYIIYRFLSFLPLTIIFCWYYYKKRNPLPIMIGHVILDFATAIQIIITSFDQGFYEMMCEM